MTEEQRLKRNAYMREWCQGNREKVRASKKTAKARELAAARARANRPKMSTEQKQGIAESKREWLKTRSPEYFENRRQKMRDHMRAVRATSEGAKRTSEVVRRYRENNRDAINARNRERRRNPTPEQRAKKNEADRQHRLRWSAERKEADRVQHRQRRRDNPDWHNANNQRRRALKKGNGGSYTAAEWGALKAEHGHRCLCCGRAEPEIKLTVDHVIPISKGGTNDIGNIQPLCYSCNASKQDKVVDYRPQGLKRQAVA